MQPFCNTKTIVSQSINVWHLGRLGFNATYRIQQLIASKHTADITSSQKENLDTLLLVEHPPVYTTGIREAPYPDTLHKKFKELGAEFKRTNRGGLITFHGPGQLVAYPIINLKNYSKSMKCYIHKLEEVVIQMCKQSYSIEAERSKDTGVWVNDNKICAIGMPSIFHQDHLIYFAAIGVHGSRYITTHGLALNCNIELNWFKHIVPCGIADKGVTSLSVLLDKSVSVRDAIPQFLRSFSSEFNGKLQPISRSLQCDVVDQLKNEAIITPAEEQQLLRNNPMSLSSE